MVLIAGGAASLYEGMLKLAHREPIKAPLLSLGVLGLSAVFVGFLLGGGVPESKRVASRPRLPGHQVGLLGFIYLSKDPNLFVTLLEGLTAGVRIPGGAVGG